MFFQIIASIINIIWYYSIWYYVSVSCIVLPYLYLTYFLYLFCFFGGVWHNYWPSRPSLVPAAPSPSLSQNDPTGQTWDWRETWFELFQLVSEEAKHSMSCCMWCATQIQPRASGFKKPHLIRRLEMCFYKQMLIYLSIHLFGYCWFLCVRPPKGASSCLTAESCIQFDSSFWLAVLSGFVYDRRKHPHERKQSKGTAGMRRIWEILRVANTESFGCRGCSSNMKRLASHSSLVGENSAHVQCSLWLQRCPVQLIPCCSQTVKLGHSLHILKGCSKCQSAVLLHPAGTWIQVLASSQVSQCCVQMRTVEFLSLLLLLLLLSLLLLLLLLLLPA